MSNDEAFDVLLKGGKTREEIVFDVIKKSMEELGISSVKIMPKDQNDDIQKSFGNEEGYKIINIGDSIIIAK